MYTRSFVDLTADSLKHPIAVIGFPGIANVGRIAAEALANILGAQRAMVFYSDDMPPRVLVNDGVSSLSHSEMYYYKSAPDEPSDIVIVTADDQPSSNKGVYEYADFISKEFNSLGVKSVYAFAAYEQGYEKFFAHYPDPPRVFISANSNDVRNRLLKYNGIVEIQKGVISGANGVIPTYASTLYSMDGICLLGETMGIIRADYRAAQQVLDKFIEDTGIMADSNILDDAAAKVVDIIEWARREIKEEQASKYDSDSVGKEID